MKGREERKKENRCLPTGNARTITRMSGIQGVDMYNKVETAES